MKEFVAFSFTALVSYWMVMFFFGVSAGFASYFPILSIFGSILLFTVVNPILVFSSRIGLIGALISCLLILPQSLMFVMGAIDDGLFNWGVLIAFLPFLLVCLSLFFSVKRILKKKHSLKGLPSNLNFKIILAAIPVVLFLVYVISVWDYLSFDMLKI